MTRAIVACCLIACGTPSRTTAPTPAPVTPALAPTPTPVASTPPVAPIAVPPARCDALPDARTSKPVFQPQTRHTDEVFDLAFSPDGKYLATASKDASVRVWELATRRLVRVLRARSVVEFKAVTWSCTGEVIASAFRPVDANGYFQSAVIAFDVATGSSRDLTLDGSGGSAVWGRTDRRACWSQLTKTGLVVRDKQDKPIATNPVKDARFTHAFAATPDGRTAVLLDYEKSITVLVGDRVAHVWPIPHNSNGHIAISRDGKRFAIGDRAGLRLFDTSTGKAIATAPPPRERYSGTVGAVALGDGVIFTVDITGIHRLSLKDNRWGRSIVPPETRDWVYAEVELSPDGTILAHGSKSGRVSLYRVSDGLELGELGAAMTIPHRVAFSGAGEALVLANHRIARWSLSTGDLLQTLVAPTIHDLAVEPDGTIVIARTGTAKCPDFQAAAKISRHASLPDRLDPADASTATKALEIVVDDAPVPPKQIEFCFDALLAPLVKHDGEVASYWRDGGIAQNFVFRRDETGFGIMRSDKQVELAGAATVGWKHLTIARRAPRVAALGTASLGRAFAALWDVETGKRTTWFSIVNDKGVGGTSGRAVTSSEPLRRIAISDDGKRVAIATITKLAVFDVASPQQGKLYTLPAGASTLALDDRRVIVGGLDGSITTIVEDRIATSASVDGRAIVQLAVRDHRALAVDEEGLVHLWDLETRVPIAAFAQFDDGEGFTLAPQGFYTGSYDAIDRIAWVFPSPALAIPASQYDRVARDPAWIAQRLACRAPAKVVELAAPPRLAFGKPPPAKITTDRATIEVDVTGGHEVVAFVEGREVVRVKATAKLKLDVPLASGQNVIELIAFERDGLASLPLPLRVERTGTRSPRGTLWVIAVGVSDYPKLPAGMQLRYADDDARTLAAVLKRTGPQVYVRTEVTVLADEAVTRTAVDDALAKLAQMGPDDVAVVLFSGHGVRLPSGKMVFVTPASSPNIASLEAVGIGWDAVTKRLAAAKGKVLVMLDACHAGAMVGELLAPNSQLATSLIAAGRGGTIVFSASRAAQISREGNGNGRFTAAFLDATGDARTDTNGNGMLELSEIVSSVSYRVMTASKSTQEPNIAWREVLGDFSLLAVPRP